jgi:hypothetical protein
MRKSAPHTVRLSLLLPGSKHKKKNKSDSLIFCFVLFFRLTVSVTVDAASATVCSISGGVVAFLFSGTCTLNANQAGNSAYNPSVQISQSFGVGGASQTLSFLSSVPANAFVFGPSYTVTASSTSGLIPIYTVSATSLSICSVKGDVVSFLGAGSCVIFASENGNGVFNAALQIQQIVTVGKGFQTLSFSSVAPVAATVQGPMYSPMFSSNRGLQVVLAVNSATTPVCAISGADVKFLAVGNCILEITQGFQKKGKTCFVKFDCL